MKELNFILYNFDKNYDFALPPKLINFKTSILFLYLSNFIIYHRSPEGIKLVETLQYHTFPNVPEVTGLCTNVSVVCTSSLMAK